MTVCPNAQTIPLSYTHIYTDKYKYTQLKFYTIIVYIHIHKQIQIHSAKVLAVYVTKPVIFPFSKKKKLKLKFDFLD
jgi:hypothetical protein